MDWSAVFDDVGEEEGDWDRAEIQGQCELVTGYITFPVYLHS